MEKSRREFLTTLGRGLLLLATGGLAGKLLARGRREGQVWQIDPLKCVSCGRCATACVLDESAVKCVHDYAMCGYCDLCTGFFHAEPNALNTAAENQLCPTAAISRRFVEDPYYEYKIDEKLCLGCARCVKGCGAFGNGSLYLQVRHDRCLNCNECAIARACPANAFVRVPAGSPYIVKSQAKNRPAAKA